MSALRIGHREGAFEICDAFDLTDAEVLGGQGMRERQGGEAGTERCFFGEPPAGFPDGGRRRCGGSGVPVAFVTKVGFDAVGLSKETVANPPIGVGKAGRFWA